MIEKHRFTILALSLTMMTSLAHESRAQSAPEPNDAARSLLPQRTRLAATTLQVSSFSQVQEFSISGYPIDRPLNEDQTRREKLLDEVDSGQLSKMEPSLRTPYGQFAATHGQMAVVGAIPGGSTTDIRVLQYKEQFWSLHSVVTASDIRPSDEFGSFVALHDDMIIVAAPGKVNGPQNEGAVYIFERDGETWKEKIKLIPTQKQPVRRFGQQLEIDANELIIYSEDNVGSFYTINLNIIPNHYPVLRLAPVVPPAVENLVVKEAKSSIGS